MDLTERFEHGQKVYYRDRASNVISTVTVMKVNKKSMTISYISSERRLAPYEVDSLVYPITPETTAVIEEVRILRNQAYDLLNQVNTKLKNLSVQVSGTKESEVI